MEEHVGRIDEEAMCRAILIGLELNTIPEFPDQHEEMAKLVSLVENYCDTFLEEATRKL